MEINCDNFSVVWTIRIMWLLWLTNRKDLRMLFQIYFWGRIQFLCWHMYQIFSRNDFKGKYLKDCQWDSSKAIHLASFKYWMDMKVLTNRCINGWWKKHLRNGVGFNFQIFWSMICFLTIYVSFLTSLFWEKMGEINTYFVGKHSDEADE